MYPSAITLKLLQQHKACNPQQELFRQYFGNHGTAIVSVRLAEKLCEFFHWTWLAEKFLSREDLGVYNENIREAKEDYLVKYNEVLKSDLYHTKEELDAILRKKSEKFKKVMAMEFARLYVNGMEKDEE